MTTNSKSPNVAEAELRAAVARAGAESGENDPTTLTAISELASYLRQRGQLVEAEGLMRQALDGRRTQLGHDHPDTLLSMNNLAGLLRVQGRLGEAEQLLVAVLAARQRSPDERRAELLTAKNNLASLWFDQDRFYEAEPLLREVLEGRKASLGDDDPSTIRALNNLASVLRLLGRNDTSERLLREAVALRSSINGPDHKDTLSSKANLAMLLADREEFAEAEAILLEAYAKREAQDGASHPETLLVQNNIAVIFRREGRYREAEEELRKAIEASVPLGRSHPLRRLAQLNLAMTLAAQARWCDCITLLQAAEPEFLNWVGTEYYTNAAYTARRQLISSQENLQNLVLTIAQQISAASASALAASVILHFKALSFDEDAFVARISRNSSDPDIRTLTAEITSLRNRLTGLVDLEEANDAFDKITKELDSKELQLALRSRSYAESIQARRCTLAEIREALPVDAALVEFRQYKRVDFRSGTAGDDRFAAIWLDHSENVRVVDLGAASRISSLVGKLLPKRQRADDIGSVEEGLSSELLKPFEDLITKIDRLYVAPDGFLYLVPFGTLPMTTRQRLVEVVDVRQIQVGRDLIAPRPPLNRGGLVAMGEIDFDHACHRVDTGEEPIDRTSESGGTDDVSGEHAEDQERHGLLEGLRFDNARTFGKFKPLVRSGEEVKRAGALYRWARTSEPAPDIILGTAATKRRILNLERCPRVLHLATHGFYREGYYSSQRPLLSGGIAFAGANLALRRQDCDALLFAIEACNLNLEGTELVILSACETARGRIDYAEGISGLVRAFQLAGARNVLATLRPVDDSAAANFMKVYYEHLLDPSAMESPGNAFRKTQKHFLNSSSRQDDDVQWKSFMLFGPD